jgi:hypothetical protein
MKRVIFLGAFAINKFIGEIVIDGLTDRPQITNESFFDGDFLFVSPLLKFVLTD